MKTPGFPPAFVNCRAEAVVRCVSGWLLVLFACCTMFQAYAGDIHVRDQKDERDERGRGQHESKQLKYDQRYARPDLLAQHLKDSKLFKDNESKDGRQEDLGHTIRNHVPDHNTRENIERLVLERDKTMTGNTKSDLSVYYDIGTAERAIERSEKSEFVASGETKSNATKLEEFKADPRLTRLTLYHIHEENVGVVYGRKDKAAPIDVGSREEQRGTITVYLKNRKGDVFINTSYIADPAKFKNAGAATQ